MLRNEEGYNDPTAQRALRQKRKGGVMREAGIEAIDYHRVHVPEVTGWTEAEEQEVVVKWAEAQACKYPCLHRLYHCPNGGSRHPAEAVHLKHMGVKPGVPDLFLPYPVGEYHGLFIEMKAENGVLRATQRDWLEWLREQGYAAYVCKGADAAIRCIEAYIGNDFSAVGTAKPITRTRCI